MTAEQKPTWERFENFEGPTEEERTNALRRRRREEGHGGNSYDGGSDSSAQRAKMGQKVPKFRLR